MRRVVRNSLLVTAALSALVLTTDVMASKHDKNRHDKNHHDNNRHDEHNEQIFKQPFAGNTQIQTNNGNNNGGNLQTGGNGGGNNGVGNGNGGPIVPSVPVPGAVWLFGSALVGFVTISRNRKSK
jgi:hypothetical protein